MELSKLTIEEYSSLLEAKKSVPGGGSALALVLEIACDLALMCANFTLGKKGYESVSEEVFSCAEDLKKIKTRAHELIDEDGKAYQSVMDAFHSGNEKDLAQASLYACEVPYEVYTLARQCETYCNRLFAIGNKNIISDARIGADLCKGIYPGCLANIKCNISHVEQNKREKFLSLSE